ncbi:MAG: 16S rRNA (cytidine(1402)-2'-O)-methyltransferase [bacterium JZ-2024 1]
MASLYVIAVPIGNLYDISERAKMVLRDTFLLLCEDTRSFRKLLRVLPLPVTILSYHTRNEFARVPKVLSTLAQGKNVALVSEAGTPGLSDPGQVIVRAVRNAGFPVVPIPGPSALCAALSVTGFPVVPHLFLGFLPKGQARRRNLLARYRDFNGSIGIFASPHNVLRIAEDLASSLPSREVLFARELTKLHEETMLFPVEALPEILRKKTTIRGEITLILSPPGWPRPAHTFLPEPPSGE